jgi:nicotinate phosphoribosyltransferase
MSIITSLLDTDLYQLTQMQAILHQFPTVHAEYKFKCKTPNIVWTPQQVSFIKEQVDLFCKLTFTEDELVYLRTFPYFKKPFIEFLRYFRLNRENIEIDYSPDGKLDISISGPWRDIVLFETPVLAIVEEAYNYAFAPLAGTIAAWKEGKRRLAEKIDQIKAAGTDFRLIEFGSRRRYSKIWQSYVVETLAKELGKPYFVGTSNVALAKEFGLECVGTMSHAWLQAGQALVNVKDSVKYMLQKWADEYKGQLGIALSDVVGVRAFLRDFDLYFANLYNGCRQDSGDPLSWGYLVYNHYLNLGIDPLQKLCVFSDSLTTKWAIQILKEFRGKLKMAFAMGNHLANDVGTPPVDIVIKMTKCNGKPVAKISDSVGKCMCDDDQYLDYLKRVFWIG